MNYAVHGVSIRTIADPALQAGSPARLRNDHHGQVYWLPDRHARPAFPV